MIHKVGHTLFLNKIIQNFCVSTSHIDPRNARITLIDAESGKRLDQHMNNYS